MKTIRHAIALCNDTYERIAEVNLSDPAELHPVIASDTLNGRNSYTWTDISGNNPVNVRLCSYGAAWRFWVVE